MGWEDAAAGAGSGAAAGAMVGGPWGAVIGAGVGLFGSLFGAHMQSEGAKEAAQIEADAQKYAADLQSQGNAQALKFTQAQAENAFQNNEAARQGNYGQYAARERRLGSVGQLVGFGEREIPAYVPGVDPNFTGSAAPSVGQALGAGGTATAGGDPVTQALLDNYKTLGVTPTGPGTGPTDLAYFVKQAKESLAAGERPLSYWLGANGRVAQEIAKAKGGAQAPAAASVGAYLSTPYQAPYAQTPITPGLPMPGSVGSYLNG